MECLGLLAKGVELIWNRRFSRTMFTKCNDWQQHPPLQCFLNIM